MKHSTVDAGNLISSLWEAIKDNIPDRQKQQTALNMINVLINQDIIDDVSSIEEAYGCDSSLDSAIDEVIEEYKDDEDGDDEFGDYDDE